MNVLLHLPLFLIVSYKVVKASQEGGMPENESKPAECGGSHLKS